jgi:hypothetical protein
MKRSHALPQHLHLMAPRSRTWRLCGALTGGFARVSEKTWLRKFFLGGGGLCPECKKVAPTDVLALMSERSKGRK